MTLDRSGEKVRWRDGSARGPYIRTWSGRRFHLADPTPDQFVPYDIAHHLAGVMRYTGASRYTVAQHCVVASLLARHEYGDVPGIGRAMLVHDVAEAFYGDMSSPLKHLCPDYRAVERRADTAVEVAFGTKFVGDPLVKEIDDRMWLTESRRLFGAVALEDYSGPLTEFSGPLVAELFLPWKPPHAEYRWEREFRALFPDVPFNGVT